MPLVDVGGEEEPDLWASLRADTIEENSNYSSTYATSYERERERERGLCHDM